MKKQTFISFMVLLLLASVSLIGCNNDGGGALSQDTRALTENDFANDPSLRADPEKHLIVKFLEHPDSEKPESDTGEVGNDTIPFRYTRTLEHTFCWEDDDGDAGHFMELDDSDGNEIFRLDVNGECITVVLEAGDYVMHIHHDGRIETTHAIFIIPSQEDGVQADTSTDGLIKNGKVLLSNILQNLHNTITQNVKAQTVPTNVSTLLTTGACPSCDLAGANLTGVELFASNLAGANLTGANLNFANLSIANLAEADLVGANLNFANLSFANLAGADFVGANLTDAILTQANLIGADLTGATWCDGSKCAAGSTGTCELVTRYFDNCDGTISDGDTGLMWEKKTGQLGLAVSCTSAFECSDPHDVNNTYTWSSTGTAFDGTASTVFLAQLNDVAGRGCFVGHCDWRLPEVGQDGGRAELESIVDLSQGSCGFGSGAGACIDPIFGPTAATLYWSATTLAGVPAGAWLVNFGNRERGDVFAINKGTPVPVRAVRTNP